MVNKDDFPSVHTINTAAAPCGANTMLEVRDRLDIPRIIQGRRDRAAFAKQGCLFKAISSSHRTVTDLIDVTKDKELN